ncbi:MAG TPA: uracil-DNA glycosylase family protein [Hanamia sp.]|nr:uracil-DNA glycosylase family protein [Hanamia sp.]
MKTFADKIISFNKNIVFNGKLPKNVGIMNPFKENKEALNTSSKFYKKFYNDTNKRHLILGINPGRFGAGVTGVPFTDTKRLLNECGLEFSGKITHEPSATFIYEMINAYGSVEKFYSKFYIHSICPLGFTIMNEKGKEVNYNYYDSKELTEMVYDFMIENIKKQISFGINSDVCFCFGTGKNEKFLRKINDEFHFFKKIIALEHPRFIMQYRSKSKQFFIEKYLQAFGQIS